MSGTDRERASSHMHQQRGVPSHIKPTNREGR